MNFNLFQLNSPYTFGKLLPSDLPFLKEMFYLSLFVPPGESAFPRNIIDQPNLDRYYQDWGKEGDLGIMAVEREGKVGAIWVRFFTEENKGYGFVREDAPELGIAIKENHRSKGLGKQLMNEMFEELKSLNIPAVSLSTDIRNNAFHLYQKMDFKEISREGYSCVMIKNIL